jgi:hypothetical protein
MIEITGSAQRSFVFPADRPTAFEYYADLRRTFSHLPHIKLITNYAQDSFRMLFSTTELGIYRIRIYCDLQAEFDRTAWVMRIKPLEDVKAASREAGMYSMTAPGYFSSTSVFHAEGEHTRIDYKLDLSASLLAPLALRFMPEIIVEAMARAITQRRFGETVDGFIERSLEAYRPGGKMM